MDPLVSESMILSQFVPSNAIALPISSHVELESARQTLLRLKFEAEDIDDILSWLSDLSQEDRIYGPMFGQVRMTNLGDGGIAILLAGTVVPDEVALQVPEYFSSEGAKGDRTSGEVVQLSNGESAHIMSDRSLQPSLPALICDIRFAIVTGVFEGKVLRLEAQTVTSGIGRQLTDALKNWVASLEWSRTTADIES